MDKSTKILSIVFAAILGGGLVAKVIYPAWIQPWLTLDERITKERQKLDELLDLEDRVKQARFQYRELAGRVGTFDEGDLEVDVRSAVNKLVEKHNLQNVKVSPAPTQRDRKTQVGTKRITISAVSSLESAVKLLADLSELPYLMQVGNAKIVPTSTSRRSKDISLVSLKVPLLLKLLPQHKVMERKLEPSDLSRPEQIVRHTQRDYSPIWTGEPLTEYIPPDPLRVIAGKDITVRTGGRAAINLTVAGGTPDFTYEWSPPEGIHDPKSPRTMVKTDEARDTVYTVTVRDSAGQVATDQIRITVEEPPQPKQRVVERTPPKPKPPPEPKGPQRWREGKDMQIVSTWLRTQRTGDWGGELMVYDTRKKENNYYGVGDEFDGGELVYVHQTGGLVKRGDDYFIYPIGARLDEDLAHTRAPEYPELSSAAVRLLNPPAPPPEIGGGDPSAAGNGPNQPEIAIDQAAKPGRPDGAIQPGESSGGRRPVNPPPMRPGVGTPARGVAPVDGSRAASKPVPGQTLGDQPKPDNPIPYTPGRAIPKDAPEMHPMIPGAKDYNKRKRKSSGPKQ